MRGGGGYSLVYRERASEHEEHEAHGPPERQADESCKTRGGGVK